MEKERFTKKPNQSALTHTTRTADRGKTSTSGTGKKYRKASHTMTTFPELGKPGALDDPRRKGLSGAGVKWYLRFLTQGLTPEEARARVDKERQEREKASPAETASTSQNKRGSEHISPTQAPQYKRRKIKSSATVTGAASKATSYATAAKITRVGILPEEYPQVILDAPTSTALEEALVEAMVRSTVRGLHFAGIHFRQGAVLVDCETAQTVNWLDQIVSGLPLWKGPKLVTRKGDDLPKPYVMRAFFPRSKGQEAAKLLKLVGVQNEEFQTDLWKVINTREESHGQILTIGIDPKSREAILAMGCTIHYRFGRIAVSGLKKGQGKPEIEETDSEISGAIVEQRETEELTSLAPGGVLDDTDMDDVSNESELEEEDTLTQQEFVQLEAGGHPPD